MAAARRMFPQNANDFQMKVRQLATIFGIVGCPDG
jgi:hypothetical protein